MSEEDEAYCRLCAELTPTETLISPDDDVGLNSKISTKLLWINVDISMSDTLPSSICFSCFDSLERTWAFLHNTRAAQAKLNEIFFKKGDKENLLSDTKKNSRESGKPVNVDWEEFEIKREVKPESLSDLEGVVAVDPNTLIDLDIINVKVERHEHSDSDVPLHSKAESLGDFSDGFNSTDSDAPLQLSVRKKKIKKKKKTYDSDVECSSNTKDSPRLTWDDYMCRCAVCDAQCMNVMSLRLHSLQIHTQCCTFKCLDCSKVINNYKTFVNHVRKHKKSLRYCCEICNKCYTRESLLRKHRNTYHANSYLNTCQNCGAPFASEEELQDHLLIYTRQYKKRTQRTVKCEKDEFDLKCEHCNKEFKTRSNLQQHKLVHTQRSRDFSCHVCGKMFFTKGTLSTHMMTHDDTRPFKCEFCPLAFRARGNLQSHISLHSDAKPFVCEQCGKSFRAKRHLKSHSIVHTDLMPYVCQYCNKTFRFKTRLNLHLRQHTGAKPYKCTFCQRDFTNGSNFKKHMKRRHNVDTSKKKYYNVVRNDGSLERSDEADRIE